MTGRCDECYGHLGEMWGETDEAGGRETWAQCERCGHFQLLAYVRPPRSADSRPW